MSKGLRKQSLQGNVYGAGMKERPILFSGPMVRAILEGRKTQTRRVVKPQPPFGCEYGINGAESHALCSKIGDVACWVPPTGKSVDNRLLCPYGQPGDRLWVKETFWIDDFNFYPKGRLPKTWPPELDENALIYAADGSCCQQLGECECEGNGATLRPSIFMPRWASRITLEIVRVRVERLQEISEDDAKAEGIESHPPPEERYGWKYYGKELERLNQWTLNPRWSYESLWESINGKGSWDANPWVWVVEFRRINTDGKELKGA